MKKKNISSDMTRDYIVEALLLLMEQKEYHRITIGEITARAGVNRSTYYRNFAGKEDIIRRFYRRLFENVMETLPPGHEISMADYLTIYFKAMNEKKKEILMLHKAGLSCFLLDVLNTLFLEKQGTDDDLGKELSVYYHTGGIFNTFLLWFDNGMSLSPEEFAVLCAESLPDNQMPMLR